MIKADWISFIEVEDSIVKNRDSYVIQIIDGKSEGIKAVKETKNVVFEEVDMPPKKQQIKTVYDIRKK